MSKIALKDSSPAKVENASPHLTMNSEIEDAPPAKPWSAEDPRFWQVGLWLLLIGIALRQLALARSPYSSDEAIHAWYTQDFHKYTYDPIYHGPLLYHLEAVVFALMRPGAAGDYIGRLVPSLLGIGTLALVLGPARRWLGAKGALWALAMLAISPIMVAYHRVLIHDALVMILTLGAVLCFQRALETQSWTQSGRQARIGLVALLTLFICTKANAFFIIVMLSAFWLIVILRRPVRPIVLPQWLSFALPMALFFIVAVASHFALRDPDFGPYIQRLQHSGTAGWKISLARVIASETTYKFVCLSCVCLLGLWALLTPNPAQREEPLEDEPNQKPTFDLRTPVMAGWVALFLFFYLYGHGVKWWQVPVEMVKTPAAWAQKFDRSITAISATMRGQKEFSVPPKKDWTASQIVEAPDWDAATMAIPRMLSYWGGQQKKPRLPGPHDYYLVLMLLYELPLVLAAIGGIWHASRRRTPFGDLLLWWAFTSFVLYAVANEKVPWLLTHIMLPLILLAGMWLGSVEWKGPRLKVLYAASVLGAVFLLRHVLATSFGQPNDQHEPMYYAQTTETFRKTYEEAMKATANGEGDVWLDPPTQWPAVWWLRPDALLKGNANMAYNEALPSGPIKVAVISPDNWKKYQPQLTGWQHRKVPYFVWARASWPALRPKTFWNFWAYRKVNTGNNLDGLLTPPGEWSHNEAVIAWKQ
ncbi:MAG TPA: glycosyltransferase family 39 protein [Abditibacteriaceae bacterium]|jgi:predicted membrane-bound mannosyltransferase